MHSCKSFNSNVYFNIPQRRRSVFNSHIARAMGKRFANDFDAQPVQRNDTLRLVILSDIELCIVGLDFVVVAKLCIFFKMD